MARGKNNVLAKVHRVRIERTEDHELTRAGNAGVRRENLVRMWIELVDGTTRVTMVGTLVDLDVVCGAKAPIDLVSVSVGPVFPSEQTERAT